MQNLFVKKILNLKSKNSVKNGVAIISVNEKLRNYIIELISLAGKVVVEVKQNMLDSALMPSLENVEGVIIDIENSTNVEEIIESIQTQISRDWWIILIGNSDSIALAQQLSELGLTYLHIQSQIHQLSQYIIKGIEKNNQLQSFFVSVLGCRGGVGTTFLSTQLAHQIATLKQSGVLFAQGPNGTQDIDLLDSNLQITNEPFAWKKKIDLVFANTAQALEIDKTYKNRYQFIVYDEMINACTRDDFEAYISYPNCLLLVFDKDFSSIRQAKNFIEIFNRLAPTLEKVPRFITCLNQSRPEAKDVLSAEDIASLLKQKIDIVIPYIKSAPAMTKKEIITTAAKNSHLNQLAYSVLGIKESDSTSKFAQFSNLFFNKNK